VILDKSHQLRYTDTSDPKTCYSKGGIGMLKKMMPERRERMCCCLHIFCHAVLLQKAEADPAAL
jgi:hypothetical protein